MHSKLESKKTKFLSNCRTLNAWLKMRRNWWNCRQLFLSASLTGRRIWFGISHGTLLERKIKRIARRSSKACRKGSSYRIRARLKTSIGRDSRITETCRPLRGRLFARNKQLMRKCRSSTQSSSTRSKNKLELSTSSPLDHFCKSSRDPVQKLDL